MVGQDVGFAGSPRASRAASTARTSFAGDWDSPFTTLELGAAAFTTGDRDWRSGSAVSAKGKVRVTSGSATSMKQKFLQSPVT